jgi:hypothetical protein
MLGLGISLTALLRPGESSPPADADGEMDFSAAENSGLLVLLLEDF